MSSLDTHEFYRRAIEMFDASIRAVGSDDWSKPTPCTEWDVRALTGHVVDEDLWVPPLLAGKTIAEVGDSIPSDPLGDDPLASWEKAKRAGLSASEGIDPQGTVHVSFGDITADEYLKQVATDHVVHAWDLAQAVGTPVTIDDDAVEAAYAYIEPNAELWRRAGAFGPAAPVPDGADRLTELVALTGRSA
jgi:uncharacterized protein (TIGR03086 family)